MKALMAVVLIVVALPLCAGELEFKFSELTVRSGIAETVYKNLRSTKIEADGIRFVHDGGVVKIGFEHLPEDVRAACGYDSDKAEAFRNHTTSQAELAAQRIAKERLERAKQENEEHEGQPKPSGPVTQADVKAVWYARLASYEISSLDRDREEKKATKATLLEAIRTGRYDHRAAIFAHEYNAWMYRQQGDFEKAKQEQDAIRQMEAILATNRLAAANQNLAHAMNRLADAMLSNPHRQYY